MLIKRESRRAGNDLHTVYRPCTVDELFGQTTNKNILKNDLDNDNVSHCYLFTGPYGCGKTTAARIVSLGLNCENGVSSSPCLVCDSCKSIINHNSMDVVEINVGKSGTKGDVSGIVDDLDSAPFNSRFRVLIFDESHALTSSSQDLLLKILEDGYHHVYFIFCTNKPQKLKDEFISRCSCMHFGRMSISLVKKLIINVCEFEGISYKEDVIDYISEESNGVPRDALVWLKQINSEGSWSIGAAKEITGVFVDEEHPQIIELDRALIAKKWKDSINIYKKIKLPAESIRIAVAGYFVGCLNRSKTIQTGRKFSKILDFLTVPIYDQGKLGDHKMYNYMFKIIDTLNGR